MSAVVFFTLFITSGLTNYGYAGELIISRANGLMAGWVAG